MSNKTLIKALPIVAAALGKKHGIKVSIRSDITTAATDGKTIFLPVLPETDEALVLARGFIDHESAHIRFTNFKVNMGKGLKKSLINILEDIRIEQRLGRELPGCRINLEALEKAFVDGGVYNRVTEQSHPAEILCARVHHCLRVGVLQNLCTSDLATNAMQVFAKAFPPVMVDKIDELLEEADNLRDTEHVCDLTDRILKVIAEESPPQESPEQCKDETEEGDEGDEGEKGESQSEDGSEGEEQAEDNSSDAQGQSDSENDDQEGKGSEEDETDDQGGNTENQTDDDQESDTDGQGSNSDGEGEEDQEDETDGAGGNAGDQTDDDQGNEPSNQGDQTDGDGEDDRSGDTDSTSGNTGEQTDDDQNDNTNDDESDRGDSTDQGDAEQQEKNRQQLLESMGDEVVESTDLGDKIAKILGDLNYEAQLHGSNSGTFPIIQETRRGVGLDPSEASRETNALRTRLNGLIQASKLKRSPPRRVGNRIDTRSLHKLRTLDTRVFRGSEQKVAVNTAVAVLIDQSSSMSSIRRDATKAAMAVALALEAIPGVKLTVAGFSSVLNERRDRYIPAVRPMKLFSQRIDKQSFVPVAEGGTPTAEALWWAASELLQQNVDRRIVITVTDGAPDDQRRVKELVGKMKHASIENNAIGIGVQISPDLFPSNCTISDISELPERVFAMLQNMLVVH